MKSTGIIRKVDELGRLVLPMELRRTMNISEKSAMEIFTEEDKIIIKKYEPGDIFTGETDDLIEYEGRKISIHSLKKIAEKAGFKLTKGKEK